MYTVLGCNGKKLPSIDWFPFISLFSIRVRMGLTSMSLFLPPARPVLPSPDRSVGRWGPVGMKFWVGQFGVVPRGIPRAAGSHITLWLAKGYNQLTSCCLTPKLSWNRQEEVGKAVTTKYDQRPLSPVALYSNYFLCYHLTLTIYCLILLVTILCYLCYFPNKTESG